MHNLGRLVSYVRPHAGWLWLGVLLMALLGVLEGISALMFRPLLQVVFEPATTSQEVKLLELPYLDYTLFLQDVVPLATANAALLVVGTIIALYFIKALSDYAGQYSVHRLGYAAVTDLRNHLYSHTIRQALHFFQWRSTGQLMSTAINDVDRVQHAISHVLTDFLRQAFTLPALLLVVFAIDWKLSLVCLITVPLIVFPVSRLGRRIRRISRQAQDQLAGLSESLQETYSGIRIVQAFGTQQWETDRFREKARVLFRLNLRWVQHYAVTSPLMEVLAAVTVGVLLLLARQRIEAGLLTPEMTVVFVVAFAKVYQPVKRLAGIYGQFQQALGASEKVFEFLDHQQEVQENLDGPVLAPFRDRIEFDRVSFSYPDGGVLLWDIELTVRAGEVVAIVGSSGAGKTTLVNLLPRFFDVTGGAIRFDGQDVREVNLESLRSQIGIVTQETILFNDTVRNNIAYGRADAPLEAVQVAARAALADKFIRELPQGYNTVIGERGLRLSGGQRQRLAIARALLRNAPILILDEATSELDTESEWQVQRALGNLMQDRTVFVIAHRLSTIRRADRIVVLENGRICEEGKHEELLVRGGVYQRLYELQFVDLDAPVLAAPPERNA